MKRLIIVLMALAFAGCSASESCVEFTDGFEDGWEAAGESDNASIW